MKKELILKISGIICAVLVVFTFLSKTIYSLTLPEVYTESVGSGYVPLSATAEGEWHCETAVEVIAGDSWRIKSTAVKNGDYVEAGDLLFTLDTTALETRLMSHELEILRIQNSLASLAESSQNTEASELKAPFRGCLLSLETVTAGQRLEKGSALGRYVDDSSFIISLPFSIAYSDKIKTGMSAEVTLSERMAVVTGQVGSVLTSDYNLDGSRVFTVNILISNPGTLAEGDTAFVDITSGDGEFMSAAGLGKLRYAKDEILTVPMSGIVADSAMIHGGRYREGETLIRMRKETFDSGGRALQRSYAELSAQLALAQRLLEQYRYPDGGEVYAECGGIVTGMNAAEGHAPSYNEKLMSIYPENEPVTVRFSLPARDGVHFDENARVTILFFTMLPDEKTDKTSAVEQSKASSVTARELSADGSRWILSAQLDKYEGVPIFDIPANISIGVNGSQFPTVVSISSVVSSSDGDSVFLLKSRKGLFGEEFYVTSTAVDVKASNPYVAALDAPEVFEGVQIVTYASSALSDGDIVTVKLS